MADSTSYELAPTPLALGPSSRRLLHCASARFAAPQDAAKGNAPYGDADHPDVMDSKAGFGADQDHASEPVTLGVSIRRTRLVAFTVTMLVLIVGFTVWFHHGVAIEHFDSRDKNTTEQTKLLDDYNSYSGNIATIFATPVELFVTVAVQVIVLRFMADTFTRPEMSWKVSGITLLLGAGVGYMISNGFNALNVQLRPEEIRPAISSDDLGLQDPFVVDLETESDREQQNSVMNTILRTVVMETTAERSSMCPSSGFRNGVNTVNGTVDEVGHSFLNLGFPQREWQSRVLEEALPTDSLRLVVNPTDKTANDGVNTSALPMSAEHAALLFDYAMVTGVYFFPWGDRRDYVNRSDILQRYPVNDSGTHNITGNLYRVHGLLPMDPDASEEAQREFFAPAVVAAASRQFAKANRTRTSDIVMEFTHTQIAPQVTFDAVTFEVEVDPELLATHTVPSADNSSTTRYTVLDQLYNCPGNANCLVRKPSYKAVEPMYDTPAQVVGFLICTDRRGEEGLDAKVMIQNYTVVRDVGTCNTSSDVSTPSLLIVSIGKRLVADALEQNVSVAANGTKIDDEASATVTNLRKIYSFTVGRLGWEVADLGKKYGAQCDAGNDVECLGVEMPLSAPIRDTTTIKNGADQQLVVGLVGISNMQAGYTYGSSARLNFVKTELLALNEPPEIPTASPLYQVMAGDLLLPHNVRNLTWDTTYAHPSCDYEVEFAIAEKIDKHHYMEHSLQTAYTSATFVLFKNAVVRDVITLPSSGTSLAFQGNSQSITVWVSTPSQNMWLTLAGCGLLVGGLLGAVVTTMWFGRKETDALAHITEPHAIARVMMDERHYPPLFLHRRIVEKDTVGTVDEFAIAALSLHQQQEQQQEQQQRQSQQQQRGRDHTIDDGKRDGVVEGAFV